MNVAPQQRPLQQRPSILQARLKYQRGYTLVEMLMVLAIVVSLFAVAASGFKKSWESQELRATAIQVANDLSLASQTAARLGKPVQVRFYKYQAIELATEKPQFYAYQLLLRDPLTNLLVPLFEMQRFQGTTLMSSFERFSSIASRPVKSQKFDPAPGIGDYEYVTVEFRPNGRTNLDPTAPEPWTITLIPVTWADRIGETPKYFQTLSIDPGTGAVRIWQ